MQHERGQAIVLIALAMVALVAIVGLAIDGGQAYSNKRNMQNAADSAAMAGTLKLGELIQGCRTGTVAENDAVEASIIDFAERNGLPYNTEDGQMLAQYIDNEETVLGVVGQGSIPRGATGIQVSMVMTDSTVFMQMMGQNTTSAGATSTGMFGVVREFKGNLLPIGVPLDVVNSLNPGQDFVIAENNNHAGGMICLDETLTTCIGDYTAHNAHRGWLNFNFIYNEAHIAAADPLNRVFLTNVGSDGCGAYPEKSVDDGLSGWAGEDKNRDGIADCPYPFPVIAGHEGGLDGDFIHGDPGARQNALRDIINTYNGAIAYVPVFDHVYTVEYVDDHLPNPQEPPDGVINENDPWPSAGGGDHAFMYHIVGFAAVNIDDPKLNDHLLEGSFVSAVIGEGPLDPSEGMGNQSCDPNVFAVTLWR